MWAYDFFFVEWLSFFRHILTIYGSDNLFTKECVILHSHQQYIRVPISNNWVSSHFNLSHCYKWVRYLLVALTYIFLMTNDIFWFITHIFSLRIYTNNLESKYWPFQYCSVIFYMLWSRSFVEYLFGKQFLPISALSLFS